MSGLVPPEAQSPPLSPELSSLSSSSITFSRFFRLPFHVFTTIHVLLVATIVAVISMVYPYATIDAQFTQIALQFTRQHSDAIRDEVEEFFDHAQDHLNEATIAIAEGIMGINDIERGVVPWLAPHANDGYVSLMLYSDGRGELVSQFGFYPNGTKYVAPPGCFIEATFSSHSSVGRYTVRPEKSPHTILLNTTAEVAFDFLARPYFLAAKVKRQWSPPVVSVFDPMVTIVTGVPIIDLSSGNTVGAFCIVIFAEQLSKFLMTLDVGKTGRVVVIDSGTESFMGGNFPESGRRQSTIINATTGAVTSVSRLAHWCEVSDPLVNDVCMKFHDPVMKCLDTCDIFDPRDNHGDVYPRDLAVRVATIDDQWGLSVRVVVIIPVLDFQLQFHNGLITAFSVTVGTVVILVAALAACLYTGLQPLRDLENQIIRCATLHTAEWSNTSIFSEVDVVIVAFTKLLKELKIVRSFLPPNILAQLALLSQGKIPVSELSWVSTSSTTADDVANDGDDAPAAEIHVPIEIDDDEALKDERTAATQENHNGSHRSSSASGSQKHTDESGNNNNNNNTNNTNRGSTTSNSVTLPLSYQGKRRRRNKKPVGLNVTQRLMLRSVVVAVINIAGSHAVVSARSPEEFNQLHRRTLEILQSNIASFGGVVDLFFGDHFYVSFNASQRCPEAVLQAAEALYTVDMSLQEASRVREQKPAMSAALSSQNSECLSPSGPASPQSLECTVRVGVGFGEAHCGMLGVDTMKQYHVIGQVVNHAHTLMRLAKSCSQGVLLSDAFAAKFRKSKEGAGTPTSPAHCFLRHVNYVRLPGCTKPCVVSTLFKEVVDASSESSLSEKPTSRTAAQNLFFSPKPYFSVTEVQLANDAFDALQNGEVAKARQLAEKAPRELVGIIVARKKAHS